MNNIFFEHYDSVNKVPMIKIEKMLEIIVDFYNELNDKDNSKKEICDPWIDMVRIKANIAFSKDFMSDDEITDSSKLADIHDNVNEFKEGYNTILCYKDNILVGFINYIYQEAGLMISEVQIKKEYQGKYKIFKKLLCEMINNCDKEKSLNIFCTINPKNKKSQEIFTYIGFKNLGGKLYKIDYDKFIKWINKN